MTEVNGIKIGDMVRVNDIEHPHPLQVMGFKKVSGTFYAVLQNPNDAEDHCECIASKLQKKKTQESEKTLEARLVREIEARGGMALKYTSQFHRGIPDRIILTPTGKVHFVELKSTGKKPTKLQVHAMNKLLYLGFDVWTIDRTERLDAFLDHICDEF